MNRDPKVSGAVSVPPPADDPSPTPQPPADPYDAVPVGYLTLTGNGVIRGINLAGAGLLGVDRSLLIGRPFPQLVVEAERPAFTAFLQTVEQRGGRESCEVTVMAGNGVPIWLRIVATASPSGEECRLVLLDITEQHQAEEGMRASRSLFRTLARVSPVGIFRTDPQGKCIYVNERWQEITGRSYTEALNTGWEQAIHPDDRPQVKAVWYRSTRENRPFKMEYRCQRPDGVVTWIQGQALAETGPQGDVLSYVGTITDISELKAMEEQHRASEAHLNEAQRLAKLGSWKRDYTGNLLIWSEEMFRITEMEPSAFGNRFENFLAVVHPDDRELLLRTAEEAHRLQAPYELEYRLKMTDGRVKWVHSRATSTYDRDGRPLVMTGSHQDITDRKRAEEALNRTRELRNLIIDTVPAFISYCDTGCRYQVANRRYEELSGLDIRTMQGRHVRDVLGEKAWKTAAPHLARVLAGEQVSYETELPAADGTTGIFEVIHTPDRDAEGAIRGYMTLVHDVTVQKKTEQTLQNYSHRLIELEDQVRRQLAAELHDEFGPDLTALNFNLTLINNETKPGERLAELVADSAQLVDGLSGKVRNIISRLQPPVLSAYGVEAALRWYAGQMKRRTGLNVAVVTETAVPRLAPDRELALFRIAKEALTNAAKYSGAKKVTVRLRDTDSMVRLTVSDDGAGFVPSSAPQPGAGGWGLTIMQMRAEMLGGTFRLKTAPGKGTSILIEIPKEGDNAD